jgi:Eco29kI restriction endonuclease
MESVHRFAFNLMGPLGDQLVEALDLVAPSPLTAPNLAALERGVGVYQLYLGDELVYVGKADNDLANRLDDHRRKIAGRANIKPENVGFTALYMAQDWIPASPEDLMIRRLRARDLCRWNGSGFGNNDYGANRERQRSSAWDRDFPVDVTTRLTVPAGTRTVPQFFADLRAALSFTFRADQSLMTMSDRDVTLIEADPTVAEAFATMIDALPPGWRLTVRSGYAILYPHTNVFTETLAMYDSHSLAT